MRVTQIQELSKTRSRVYIEEESAFVLYKGELKRYHVQEGGELSAEDYGHIMEEVLPKRAKLRAMNLLQKREYTTEELRRKLKQGFYPEQIIEEALDYVASYRYTDDLRYAVDYINCHETDKSHRRIEQDLMRRGISRETMTEAWLEWESRGGKQDEQAMIAKLLQKRHYDPEQTDRKEQYKTAAFLMRKGFTQDAVRRAMHSREGCDQYS